MQGISHAYKNTIIAMCETLYYELAWIIAEASVFKIESVSTKNQQYQTTLIIIC